MHLSTAAPKPFQTDYYRLSIRLMHRLGCPGRGGFCNALVYEGPALVEADRRILLFRIRFTSSFDLAEPHPPQPLVPCSINSLTDLLATFDTFLCGDRSSDRKLNSMTIAMLKRWTAEVIRLVLEEAAFCEQ
jgi:hypothetical protein